MQIKRIHFETIDSTNNWAKAHTGELDPTALTLITADEQTAGRGRFTRSWSSPKKCNILATFVFFLEHLRDDIGNIPQILALSALQSLKESQLPLKIKWPNDINLREKKLGGILCEISQTNSHWGVIAGIGFNINMSQENLKKIDRPAASLLSETGQSWDLEALTNQLSKRFEENLTTFLNKGFDPFYPLFTQALLHQKNDTLRFHDFQKIIEGKFSQINPDGSLNLILPDGTLKRCTSGELL
jgi:BirA family biotin operon repressor/biotin-[acetyl-CoA-carboxylase] ligase